MIDELTVLDHAISEAELQKLMHGSPQVWDLPVETAWGAWHVVGVFNLDEQA